MRIGVDIRSLAEPQPGGVTSYSGQLLKNMLAIDHDNKYIFFANSWKNRINQARFPKAIIKTYHWPNKIYNLSLNLLNWPKIDKRIGPLDLFFMPNANFISLSEKMPLVLTVHDLSFEVFPQHLSAKRRLWHQAASPRKLSQRANKIIAVSENTKRDLIDIYHIPADKIAIVHSGIETGDYETINQPAIDLCLKKYRLKKPYILTVSFLEPRKNITALMAAFDALKKKLNQPCGLVIVGQKAWRHEDLTAYQARLKYGSEIVFIGYAPEQDKKLLIKGAHAFVYPSVYEGFGFPPLESMAAGVPVVASAASALPEIIGKSAILVQPYNTAEITEALYQLIIDDNLRKKLINQHQQILQKYTWRNCAEKTLSVFNSLLMNKI